MNTQIKLTRKDLIYPELSYQIMGVLFKVASEMGYGYKEKSYQNAIENEFKDLGIKYDRELSVRITYKGKSVGIVFYDFLIEDKIVLEVKVRDYFSVRDIRQLYSYLKAKNLKLGILAHFTKSGVKYKRVLNLV
jgi:GxxExxY protein